MWMNGVCYRSIMVKCGLKIRVDCAFEAQVTDSEWKLEVLVEWQYGIMAGKPGFPNDPSSEGYSNHGEKARRGQCVLV